jgi:hypothetical protein
MLKHTLIRLAALAAVSGAASTTHAHFKLLAPTSWLNEDASGGPQKGSPCGVGGSDDVNPPPASGKVTEYHAGEEIEVKWVDTIAHPGHFRIALAENRTDLKDPTIQQDSFCSYDEMMVPKEGTASGNVLADGVSFRSRTGFSASPGTMFSQKVRLPNKPCDKCTLQVMQIMENDLQSISNCYYFHCADIKILPAEAGAAGSGAAAAGASGAGTAGAGAAGASAAGSPAAAGGGAGRSGSAAGASASSASPAGSPASSTTAGSGAGSMISTAAGAPATAAAGSVATATAGVPATGTATNGVTGAPAAATDSSGCSVNGVGAARNAASSAVLVSTMLLLNARRRRRKPNGTRR